jgi:hypothetical protein
VAVNKDADAPIFQVRFHSPRLSFEQHQQPRCLLLVSKPVSWLLSRLQITGSWVICLMFSVSC